MIEFGGLEDGTRAYSCFQLIHFLGVPRKKLPLLGFGAFGDNLSECLHPCFKRCSQSTYGPIARKNNPVRAEGIKTVVHNRSEVFS